MNVFIVFSDILIADTKVLKLTKISSYVLKDLLLYLFSSGTDWNNFPRGIDLWYLNFNFLTLKYFNSGMKMSNQQQR